MKKKIITSVRFLSFFVVFLAIVTVIGIPLSYASRPELAHTRKNITGFYAEPDDTLDVVMIGTSGTFSAYCPMEAWDQFGFTSYNFCINVLAVNAIPYSITEIMKTQTPQVLVIDCYPFIAGQTTYNITSSEQNDGGMRYNMDAFRYSANRTALIRNTLPAGYHKFLYYFDLFKYFGSSKIDFSYADWEKHDVSKGYNPLSWDAVTLNRTDITQELPLSEELDSYFNELLDDCANCDCRVLFVYYPYALITPTREIGYSGDEALEVVNYMGRKATERGFDFLNMAEYYAEIGINPARDYWGYGHFNILGAEKITAFFGRYLSEQYGLTDKRANPGYQEWQKDYREWEPMRAQFETDTEKAIEDGGK